MKWAIKHERHGFMSAMNAQLIITDPVKIRNVDGAAIIDTRTTARTVMRRMEQNGVLMDGYKPVPVRVCLEVVK